MKQHLDDITNILDYFSPLTGRDCIYLQKNKSGNKSI